MFVESTPTHDHSTAADANGDGTRVQTPAENHGIDCFKRRTDASERKILAFSKSRRSFFLCVRHRCRVRLIRCTRLLRVTMLINKSIALFFFPRPGDIQPELGTAGAALEHGQQHGGGVGAGRVHTQRLEKGTRRQRRPLRHGVQRLRLPRVRERERRGKCPGGKEKTKSQNCVVNKKINKKNTEKIDGLVVQTNRPSGPGTRADA